MKKPKVYKTTKKDFHTFHQEVNKWLSHFGVSEYEVTLYHRKISDARATCQADMENMMASIEFNTEWGYKPDAKEIKRVAFHEVWELILFPLSTLSMNGNAEEKVNEETHRIIRRMENCLLHP